MEALNTAVGWINGIVWGPAMLVLILGVGFLLQVGLKFMPILKLGMGFGLLFKGREGSGEGQISPFNALMTALSATIGTGNIAGVATAVFLGGPLIEDGQMAGSMAILEVADMAAAEAWAAGDP